MVKSRPMKASLAILSALLCACSLSLLMVSSTSPPPDTKKNRPSQIVVYLHIYRNINFVEFASTNTSTAVEGPDGNSYTPIDGVLRGVDLVATVDPSPTSKPVASVHGLAFQVMPGSVTSKSSGAAGSSPSPDPSTVFPPGRESLFEAIEYDDGKFKGNIALQGHMSFPPSSDDEIAVVGGTGSFRCVQGYGHPTLLGFSPASTYVLFRWDLRLFYPNYCH